jgi:rubrerythrin
VRQTSEMEARYQEVRGRAVRAYLFVCATCGQPTVAFLPRGAITLAEAAAQMRGDGLSQTKAGWVCPDCKTTRGGKGMK